MFPVRPLGSTGIAPLPSYYGPVRLPTRATRGLFLPQGCCGWGHSLPGLPGSSTNLLARAVPYHPGEPDSCLRPFLHCRHWASPILDGWPLSYCLTRPKWIRLRYSSRLRLTRLRQIRLPRPALDRLLVKRTTYKVCSFQLTRLARLCLAHQDLQDGRDHLPRPDAGANTASASRNETGKLPSAHSGGSKNAPESSKMLRGRSHGCLYGCVRQPYKKIRSIL